MSLLTLPLSIKKRCKATNELSVKGVTVSTTLQTPKCPPQRGHGKFPSDLMGTDAANFLCKFQPDDYVSLHFAEIDKSICSMCLQGTNIAHAVVLWLQALKWPPNMEEPDQSDWAISWFEMAVSFDHYTGFRFPVRISGAGNKTEYVAYDSEDAICVAWTSTWGCASGHLSSQHDTEPVNSDGVPSLS